MPFITKERRSQIANGQIRPIDYEPGDRCYIYYKVMVAEWKRDPRWRTADKIYQDVLRHNFTTEDTAAAQLAWQVFFNLYVLPYEVQKREENGDVS